MAPGNGWSALLLCNGATTNEHCKDINGTYIILFGYDAEEKSRVGPLSNFVAVAEELSLNMAAPSMQIRRPPGPLPSSGHRGGSQLQRSCCSSIENQGKHGNHSHRRME
jgi:hypothetical protein